MKLTNTLIVLLATGIGLLAQSTGQTASGLTFAAAYYAAQNPVKAPLYNGRPGSAAPTAQALSQTAFNALINQILATPGVTLDEQIDYWGWDPLTTMELRQTQGIAWVPSGLGPAVCQSILTSGCVITPGQYSGPAPTGAIPTCISPACEVAWPPTAPVPVFASPQVGAQFVGPYYEVTVTPLPAQGTAAKPPFPPGITSCVMAQIPNNFMIGGGGFMAMWRCQ